MPQLTLKLARQANIARHGPTITLFCPRKLEDLLYTIENQYAEKKGITDVNKLRETVFTVIKSGKQYQFQVIDQKYF